MDRRVILLVAKRAHRGLSLSNPLQKDTETAVACQQLGDSEGKASPPPIKPGREVRDQRVPQPCSSSTRPGGQYHPLPMCDTLFFVYPQAFQRTDLLRVLDAPENSSPFRRQQLEWDETGQEGRRIKRD